MWTLAMDMRPDGWWMLAVGVALITLFFLGVGFILGRVFEQHQQEPDPAGDVEQLQRWREEQGRGDGCVNEEDL
jgi:hypothetical protein